MNVQEIGRLKRIESAIVALQSALDSLQAQVTELKKAEPKRETLTLRKSRG